jgi:hypothetical protein
MHKEAASHAERKALACTKMVTRMQKEMLSHE